MHTKDSGPAQVGTQHLVPQWQKMDSAPVGSTDCIDIWSGAEKRRYTDCFWSRTDNAWCFEVDEYGAYKVYRVPDPVAWMPVPSAPAGEGA